MIKYVRDTAAGKSISAYVILNKKGETVATVQAHFSNGGTVTVNVWGKGSDFQHGKAGGYGYDKFAAALDGMTIDGHAMTDSCSRLGAPKKPKGRKLYPRDFKPRKGYTLANYSTISKETGNRIYGDEWIKRAYEALGIADARDNSKNIEEKNNRFSEVEQKARDLQIDWEKTGDCETGYADCYRLEGFKYLEAIGYRVIQAI